MRKLTFWKQEAEVIVDDEGNSEPRLQWHCSDGISTFFGDTKSEAASHFGVPVGFPMVVWSGSGSAQRRSQGTNPQSQGPSGPVMPIPVTRPGNKRRNRQ